MLLEIAVYDDTSSRPLPSTLEIWVEGAGSWFPDMTFGADAKELGSFAIGEPGEFYIYPDGRGGSEIRVAFEMTSEMISGSAMSQTIVAISDSDVTVTGQAIPGTEQVYPR